MEDIMTVSEAHIKASNKYNAKTYKQLKINIRPSDYDIIDNYCKDNNISKASLILNACKEYINNHSE